MGSFKEKIMIFPEKIYKDIKHRLFEYLKPQRKALSRIFPFLISPLLFLKRSWKKVQNARKNIQKIPQSSKYYNCVIACHQSVLRRTLGNSNPKLQEQKIINIKNAIQHLDGVIIKPNEIFSLWEQIGNPNKKRGFVNGMLLSGGKIVEGTGGGLCQLSNFLCWIFLHTQSQIIERNHHSFDSFPDSGRVIPFGSGATIFYNLLDLKIKNTFHQPIQIKLWLTEKHLKGQILSLQPRQKKFHITEKFHCFVKYQSKFFRYNQIWREEFISGNKISEEHIFTNFAPILYPVTDEYLQKNNFTVIDI
jgi:vancomycin resistance protein VanW